uniref:CMP/dCMP-type deaminase domain-containing protein n=1 Tax=Ficedula albicollis TaxID=59894 RepID=A0A803VV81_FICAL
KNKQQENPIRRNIHLHSVPVFLFSFFYFLRALRQQFDPRTYPSETYLLCELQWGGSGRFWIHWARNDEITDSHVEHYFLEQIFEPRSYSVCDITWYLSWSPCANCCDIIQEFLEEQHNVNLDIRVARVYNEHIRENRAALRQLANFQGAAIRAMDVEGKVSHALWAFDRRSVRSER